MSWPLSQDYNEAVQNPLSTFSDPELKQSEVATNDLGLPMPCSGNFADVYELNHPAGGKWAVKCFTRQIPGIQDRYLKISNYLQKCRLPFIVQFNFLEQGVKVRGQWYPILKMDWVEGLSLNEFVDDYVDRPRILQSLCDMWVKLATGLREARLAHCDLQHGNVLLVPGGQEGKLSLRLVDYDGMWVPALERSKSIELGHSNYQHPQRQREGLWSNHIDSFSHLVIYTALRAVASAGKPLWQRCNNGDNLLFKQTDLVAPTKSPLFAELFKSGDPAVKYLAGVLMDAARQPLAQTPLLYDVVQGIPRTKTARRDAAVALPRDTVDESLDWERVLGEARRKRRRAPRKRNRKLAVVLLLLLLAVGAVVGGDSVFNNGAWLSRSAEFPGAIRDWAAVRFAKGSGAAGAKPTDSVRASRRRSVDDMVSDLKKEQAERLDALAELVGLDSTKAATCVPGLKLLLKDPMEEARLAAVQALKSMRLEPRLAVESLSIALEDRSPEVKIAAVDALRGIGPAAASVTARLVALGKDEQEQVRAAAGQALEEIIGRIKTALDRIETGTGEERAKATQELTMAGANVIVVAMRSALGDSSATIRSAAVAALGSAGAATGNPELRAQASQVAAGLQETLLHDRDEGVRVAAARALARVRSDPRSAVRVLRRALADEPSVQIKGGSALKIAVLGALAGFGPDASDSIPDLVRLFGSDDANLREAAGRAAVAVRPKTGELTGILARLVKESAMSTRVVAATLLGKVGAEGEGGVVALADVLKDNNQPLEVRLAAAGSLGELHTAAKPALPIIAAVLQNDKNSQLAATILDALEKMGPEAAQDDVRHSLGRLLIHPQKSMRERAIGTLAKIDPKTSAALSPLRQAASDVEVLHGLGDLLVSREEARRSLATCLLEGIDPSARPVLDLLAKPGPAPAKLDAKSATWEAFQKLSPEERRHSCDFLGRLGPVALPLLRAALWSDSSREVKAAAARSLPVPELIAALKEAGAFAQVEAANALGARGSEAKDAVPELMKGLYSQYPTLRDAATRALARIGKPAVAALNDSLKIALKKNLADQASRICYILAQIGPEAKEAIPTLIQATKDPSAAVALGAKEALAKIQSK